MQSKGEKPNEGPTWMDSHEPPWPQELGQAEKPLAPQVDESIFSLLPKRIFLRDPVFLSHSHFCLPPAPLLPSEK